MEEIQQHKADDGLSSRTRCEALFPVSFGSSGSNEGAKPYRAEERKVSTERDKKGYTLGDTPFPQKVINLSKSFDEVRGENRDIVSD